MKKQYKYLSDLTHEERIVLAAMHIAMDDAAEQSTSYKLEYNPSEQILEFKFIYHVEGHGTKETNSVKLINNTLYGDSEVISELEQKLREMKF